VRLYIADEEILYIGNWLLSIGYFTTLKELNLNNHGCNPTADQRTEHKAHSVIKFEKKILYAPQGIKFIKIDMTGFQNLSCLEEQKGK